MFSLNIKCNDDVWLMIEFAFWIVRIVWSNQQWITSCQFQSVGNIFDVSIANKVFNSCSSTINAHNLPNKIWIKCCCSSEETKQNSILVPPFLQWCSDPSRKNNSKSILARRALGNPFLCSKTISKFIPIHIIDVILLSAHLCTL